MTYGYGPPPPQVPEVTVDELEKARAGGAPLIDVREPEEYVSAHVPGAVLIPLGEVVERVEEVNATEPVYVICGTGLRSAKAVQWYRRQGIDAYNVAGGTQAWIKSGKPAATGRQPG
ncbi:MAG: rhodanese-like domain-containing protein [Actinobacteria bacterium]|nr:rhodanese-like domain-containing protein [Actinomycetota bacterium]